MGDIAYFTGLNLAVPNGGSGLNQDIYVSYAEVGIGGAPSGSTSNIALTYAKHSSPNGTTSLYTPNIPTPTMKLVGSKPSISLSASGSTLTAGLVDVAHVTVSADAKGGITLNQLPISYRLSGATLIDGVVVKDQNGQQVSISSIGNSQINFTGGYLIPAGTNQTFRVYFQLGAIEAPGATLTVGLGLPGLFGWTDTAGNSSYPITSDNSTYLFNYSTNTVSLSGGVAVTPTTPITSPQIVSSCTDSDGGQNPNVAGLTDGRVNGIGSYFNDSSVASNGSQCSGDSCTSVAEGYCTSDGKVTNTLMSCSTGYSVNGACAPRPVVGFNLGGLGLSASALSAFSSPLSFLPVAHLPGL